MSEVYAIIDDVGGWLVNIVVWDGDTTTWQPPVGTHAVLASQVDFSSLLKYPEDLTPSKARASLNIATNE